MSLFWPRYLTLLCLCILGTWASANTLRAAYDADPVSLDPYKQLSGGTLQLAHLLYDPLIRWTPQQDFEGRLATSGQLFSQPQHPYTSTNPFNGSTCGGLPSHPAIRKPREQP